MIKKCIPILFAIFGLVVLILLADNGYYSRSRYSIDRACLNVSLPKNLHSKDAGIYCDCKKNELAIISKKIQGDAKKYDKCKAIEAF